MAAEAAISGANVNDADEEIKQKASSDDSGAGKIDALNCGIYSKYFAA